MTRRNFIISVAALATPLIDKKDKLPPREFYRYDYTQSKWDRIEPSMISAKDVIWIHDPPPNGYDCTILVSSVDHDKQELYSGYQIDPKTNEWVLQGSK